MAKTLRAHKIALDPNNVQATYFAKAAGTARHAYNWALDFSQSEYKAGRPISGFDLKKAYRVIQDRFFPWAREVTKCSPEQAIADLNVAFRNFWSGRGGYPTFKKKDDLAKLHDRIANIRGDAIHKLTTDLVEEYDFVAIEDLNVSGMVKNHCLARSINDQSFGAFRRLIEYKAQSAGVLVQPIDRFYPSTKTCSACGVCCTICRWTSE